MSTTATFEALKAAGDKALAGENPWDTFASYGMTLEAATVWTVQFVEELIEKASALGEDPDDREFVYKLAVGALAIGIEHGRNMARGGAAG